MPNQNPVGRTAALISTVLALALGHPANTLGDNFHVANAQDLQNALTTAAANGADDVIYFAAGYYGGNFNFNSAEARSLTLTNEPGVTNSQITVDGTGTGVSMSLSSSANANLTVQGMTFVRNGNTGLYLATGSGGGIVQVQDCNFLPPPDGGGGIGLAIMSGQSAMVQNCTANGYGLSGHGMILNGLAGNASIKNCFLISNTCSVYFGGGGIYLSIAGTATLLGNTFVADGSRIVQGHGTYGGGAQCQAGTISLVSNVFNSCDGYYGAGLYANARIVTLSNSTFTANTEADGAVVGVSGDGNYAIGGNTFVGNSAGWGLNCSGTGTLNGNTFAGNYGGAYLSGGGGQTTVGGNSFNNNTQLGGLYCYGHPSLSICNNIFIGNANVNAGGYAGGISLYRSTGVTISNNTFSGNSSVGMAGAIYAYDPNDSGAKSLVNNTFSGNSTTGPGGAVYCDSTAGIWTISRNVFKQNAASAAGGAIYANAFSLAVLDNLIVQNTSGGAGGGLWLNPLTNLDLINNTITGNTNAGNGGGAAVQVNGLTEVLHVYNNIIWGNSTTGHGGDVYLAGTGQRKEFAFNDVDDMYGVWDIATNNPDVDPQFFDPINGDYHLRPTSGCVNAGNTNAPSLPTTDLDGNSRTNSAGMVDLGCYEFNNSAYHPADANADWIMGSDEFNSYAAAWQNSLPWAGGPNPVTADFVTRAGYLLLNGGVYHNDGSAPPVNWKPGTQ